MPKMRKNKRIAYSVAAGLIFSSLITTNVTANSNLNNVSAIKANAQQLQTTIDKTINSALSEDTLLVKYKSTLSQTEHRIAGATLIKQFSEYHFAVVKVRDKKNINKVIAKYQSLKNVESVTPSSLYKPLSLTDPKISEQYQINMLQLNESQKLAGNAPVTIAVIDQGVDMNHPDLKGRLLPSYNAVNPMNQGTPDFHGTHVAGIVSANKNNGIGGYGVNPNAKILPIDVFDGGWGATDYAIAEGIKYAVEKGSKVINMSLGGPMDSPLIKEAVKKALEKNVVVIAAAGNTGDDTLSYPAAYEGVISVGSINDKKKLSSFSSYGPSIDIVAPGEEIYAPIYEYGKQSSFAEMSGTSMASPMVAGVASLLLSKYPKLTPTEIEYILEHTSEDLGEKGYDIKFGNGLVNPLAALKFNLKELPAYSKKKWSEKEIFENAEKIDLSKEANIRDSITEPNQEIWYQSDVRIGDSVQFVLEGASQYDYKLTLYLQSPDGKDFIEVDSVQAGDTEGKLYHVPHSGKIAFGVKDVNGNYDNTNKKSSSFNLKVKKVNELPADTSSLKDITKLDLTENVRKETLIGPDGDDDFYNFVSNEDQNIRINLSSLPGVDTSISVYDLGGLFSPEESISEEEKQEILKEMLSGEYPIDPIYYANKSGKSKEETLTFKANAEMPYLVKVSNKNENRFGIYDFYMNETLMETEQKPESSLYSYTISVEGKLLPEDEDMFPMFMGEESTESLDSQKEMIENSLESSEELDHIEMIESGSQPYELGQEASGYLQMMEDEDWFSVTAAENGIYRFNISDKADNMPSIEIFTIKEIEDEKGEKIKYLDYIGSNSSYDWVSNKLEDHIFVGFKKNETYYIRVGINYFNGDVSFDPYQFSAESLILNPQDKYEDNDGLTNIKDLPGDKTEANFAMPYDQDLYYFQPKESKIYGITLQNKKVNEKWKSQYPKELLSSYYGFIQIYEDVNKSRSLDKEEQDTIQVLEKGAFSGTTYGSFKADKDKSYMLMLSAGVDGPVPLSLIPYQLEIGPVQTKDEDADSKVRNNIPSKPLKIKKVKTGHYQNKGYLNAGVPYGDEDWYEFSVGKNSKGQIEFSAGVEVDGEISLYKNGKLIARSNYYASGDEEVLPFNLTKGIYHIKVRDAFGNTTINPYTLSVRLK